MVPRPASVVVLTELELRHFRNLGVQEMRFPPEGVAVVGDNAQGKSNLLEAIYYLESFRSFRGVGDGQLGAFSEDVFHLQGAVAGERPATVSVGFDRKLRKKKVTVDGNDAPRIADALGRLGAVTISPADAGLVAGGPGGRRRFLDVVLSLNAPGYVKALLEYRRALVQRNAALRAGSGRAAVRAWEPTLVEHGAEVTASRSRWVTAWAESFAAYYQAVSGKDAAAMEYRPNLSAPPPSATPDSASDPSGPATSDATREEFRQRLDDGWDDDARRGSTGSGAHRDELRITVQSGERRVPLRTYGSGGQRRTAALALRLVEAATIRRQRAAEPILLVDDAFAELDPGRSERVMSLMEEEGSGQVILTAPKESDVRLRSMSLPRWRIRAGEIEA